MRIIDGYVIIQKFDRQYLFFGKSMASPGGLCRLEDNGLVPFRELRLALAPTRSFLNQRHNLPEQTYSARLHLEIAESWDDLDVLIRTRQRSFVVVFGNKEGYQLLGQRVTGQPGVFDGGEYLSHGAAPFENVEDVLHLRDEASRQGMAPAAVAFYRLRLFPAIDNKTESLSQKIRRPKR